MRKDDMEWYDMKYDMTAAESSMIKWSLHDTACVDYLLVHV